MSEFSCIAQSGILEHSPVKKDRRSATCCKVGLMVPVMCALLCFLALTGRVVAVEKPYWTVSEFYQRNPEQQEIATRFSAVVRAPAQPLRRPQSEPVRILVVYPGKQVSDYWSRSVSSFEARMKELGIRYTLRAHFTRAVVAKEQQQRLLERAKVFKPDYLVFTLDAIEHQAFIEQILRQKNAPRVILQNITTPLKAWADKQPFIYVGFDHIKGTRVLADYYLKQTQGKGRYAVVCWAPGYISEVRGDSFVSIMEQHSGLQLSSSYYTNASRYSGYKMAQKAITADPYLSFIYACSTDVAMGVLQAIKEHGLQGKLLLNGWGGGSLELSAIQKGELDATVMRMNDDNGVAMAEAIKLELQGDREAVPKIYSGEFKLVDQGTSRETLKQLESRAFRYSGLPAK